VSIRVIIDTFQDKSIENTNEGDDNEEFETFLSGMASYFQTSKLTIKGILGESSLTGKNVSILTPTFSVQWGTLWSRKPDVHCFYVLYIDKGPYEELLLGLPSKPSESLLGSYVQVSGTLTYRRMHVTDFFDGEAYVLYVDDLEILSP